MLIKTGMQAANTHNTQTNSKEEHTQITRQTVGRTRRTAKTKAHKVLPRDVQDIPYVRLTSILAGQHKRNCYSDSTAIWLQSLQLNSFLAMFLYLPVSKSSECLYVGA